MPLMLRLSTFLNLLFLTFAFQASSSSLQHQQHSRRRTSSCPQQLYGWGGWFQQQSAEAETDPKEVVGEEVPDTTTNTWSPRSKHWINDDFFQTKIAMKLSKQIQQEQEQQKQQEHDDGTENEPKITNIYKTENDNVVAVEIESAITSSDIHTIKALSSCIRATDCLSGQHRQRSFGNGQGGNDWGQSFHRHTVFEESGMRFCVGSQRNYLP